MELFNEKEIISLCPVSGLKIITSPDWTDLDFASGYRVTYRIIDKNIILCQAIGSADLGGIKQALEFSLELINKYFNNNDFVYIEDFSKVISPTTECRKYYIEHMKSLKKMKLLVYYNLSPLTKLNIKLAQKLNFFKFDVHITKGYSDAVSIAKKTLSFEIENNKATTDKIITTCPITGVKLTTRQDWKDVEFHSGFSVSYKIIERNIFMCKAVGSGNLEGLKKSQNFGLTVINKNFNNEPFVCIEDFEKALSPTSEARKYYIHFMKSLKKMKMLIYLNLSPIMSFSIRLARKLNYFGFNVYIAKSYQDAVEKALEVLDINKKQELKTISDHYIESKPDWKLDLDGFSVCYELINENIFHLISKGTFGVEHIDQVFEYQEELIKNNLSDKFHNYYFVVDLNEFNITRACRKLYSKKIQSLYDRLPFKTYIYHGGSRLVNIGLAMGTQFINFNFKRAKNFDEVLNFVKKDSTINKKKVSDETQKYIDEFLVFLGKINWEKNTFDKDFKKDTTHPFYQVYDAITLIKTDLDELYLERQKNEEEKVILQHKLQQSLKLETMGKLAGSVAHDLNNVLSGIVSYPDIIMKTLPVTTENAKSLKYIKRMKNSGQKAADIVQDLLTLSRSGVVSFEPVNINSIIEEYLRSPEYKKLISDNPTISTECSLSEELNKISASAIHLTKTIMNLITNAIEAIPEQGVIKIKTRNINFKNKQLKGYDRSVDGDYIELIVSDSGVGISEQDQLKIFEPFYSKKVVGRSGTGLGMMVIKGTVDDHKGFIIINSKENKGTEFILYFPIDEDGANKKIIKKIDNYTGKGESVLIIDDDEDQRIIASKILSDLYYNVNVCSSGEKAVEYLKKECADIIILDMIMTPGIDGLETYKQIIKTVPNQKAIIVSGYSTSDHVIEAQKLGAGKYIRKPYTIEEIGIAVFEEIN